VKAAWKILGLLGSGHPDDTSRFYTTEALVVDPVTGACSRHLMGLVGLHVVLKTAQLPRWLWATFEQVDNAPDQATGPAPKARYNFFNPACYECPFNTPPTATNNLPTQVVRVTPVDATAATANADFQSALRTLRPDNVWQYYQLVDAQWGSTSDPTGANLHPPFLANTTLETYLQQPQNLNGCLNCHGTLAAATDLDFQLTDAYPRSEARKAIQRKVFAVPGVGSARIR
jgi:hypothetical protein